MSIWTKFSQWLGLRSIPGLSSTSLPKMVSIPLPFSDELLLVILSYVPSNDLLNNCIWVREWQDLIDSQSLWLLKCQREGKPLPSHKPDPLPHNFYRYVYFVPYGQNLLRNSSGQDKLDFWENSSESYDSHWIVENPPVGTDPIPDTVSQSCFVSTYSWCEKQQSINLLEYVGNYSQILDLVKPSIEVSESYAARFDCGGDYQLVVFLESASGEILDTFEFQTNETHNLRVWQQVKHVFSDYPDGVRTIRFLHRAKDTQFWAGHYGMKLSCAKVCFVLNN